MQPAPFLATLLLLLALLLAGCGASSGTPQPAAPNASAPAAGPDIRGQVTNLQLLRGQGRNVGAFNVEGNAADGLRYDRAAVAISPDTLLFKLVGGERQPASLTDLADGQTVAVRFTGDVAESYPVQATAGEIVILE